MVNFFKADEPILVQIVDAEAVWGAIEFSAAHQAIVIAVEAVDKGLIPWRARVFGNFFGKIVF